MSRRSRVDIEQAGIEAIRGWQTDQDMFDEALAAYIGINRTDARCVDILDRGGRMTAGQLATAARLTTGAVTAVVDRLERVGLVRRVPDPTDRRRVLVEVTPKLAEVSAPVFGPLGQEGAEWIANYGDEELELIVGFMEKNREILNRHTNRLQEMLDDQARKRATKAG